MKALLIKRYSRSLFILFILFIFIIASGCGNGGSDSSKHSNNKSPGYSITLIWNPPLSYPDGSQFDDLEGYHIYYGTSPGNYSHMITIGNTSTYKIDGLAPGTYFFVISAYNSSGYESNFSNEETKTIY